MHFKQAVSTLLLSAACLSFAQADVKVGVITSSTGPIALVGLPQKNSIPLLPTQAGDQPVTYIALDDGSAFTVAVGSLPSSRAM